MLAVVCWLLLLLFVVCCLLFVVGCWLLVVGCWLLVTESLLVVGRWLLVVGCWLSMAAFIGSVAVAACVRSCRCWLLLLLVVVGCVVYSFLFVAWCFFVCLVCSLLKNVVGCCLLSVDWCLLSVVCSLLRVVCLVWLRVVVFMYLFGCLLLLICLLSLVLKFR